MAFDGDVDGEGAEGRADAAEGVRGGGGAAGLRRLPDDAGDCGGAAQAPRRAHPVRCFQFAP